MYLVWMEADYRVTTEDSRGGRLHERVSLTGCNKDRKTGSMYKMWSKMTRGQ